MANSKQARKRVRQAEKRRQHNVARRSKMRTLLKRVREAIANRNKAEAESAFRVMTSILDKFACKGLIHKNKAARHKRSFAAQIKAL